MGWHTVAGVAQLILLTFLVATHVVDRRTRRAPGGVSGAAPVRTGELVLAVVPMLGLAAGTLARVGWVVVVAAIFYSVWLVNHLFSWRDRPAPVRAHAILAALSVAVLAMTWCAAAVAHAGIVT